jgi:hypothetical protein
MNWRPEGWANPYQKIRETHVTADMVGCKDDPAIFEVGADAMFKAICSEIEKGLLTDEKLCEGCGLWQWRDTTWASWCKPVSPATQSRCTRYEIGKAVAQAQLDKILSLLKK